MLLEHSCIRFEQAFAGMKFSVNLSGEMTVSVFDHFLIFLFTYLFAAVSLNIWIFFIHFRY